MKNSRQKSKNIRRCAAESALFAAALFCLLFLYKGMYPFGDGSIMITDLYSQYVPLLYRFYDVVTGQKNLFVDLAVSGGVNLYADTVNELINPFNYVLLLFGRENLYLGVNVLLFLYGTAAAASCRYFLEKIRPGEGALRGGLMLALSLCYAFSGYTAYNYQIIRWMYFPVLFPFFMLALLRLLREKKGGLYGILLAYQLMLSVQLGFMTLLFVLFAGGLYGYLCIGRDGAFAVGDRLERENIRRERTGRLACLAKWTIAGLLLSSAVLVPALIGLFSSARSGETLSYFGVMKRHGLEDLFERIFQIGQPILLAVLACEARCLMRRCRKSGEKLSGALAGEGQFWFSMCIFLWLTALLQPANLLWHLGSYVCFPVRYGYMTLLCMTALAVSIQDAKEKRALPEAERAAEETSRGHFFLTGAIRLAGLLCLVGAAAVTIGWENRIVQAFSSLAISSVCPAETLAVLLVCMLLAAGTLCLQQAGSGRGLTAGRRLSGEGTGPVLCAAVCGFCLYTMIFLPQDYAVRQENEAAYAEMTREEEAYQRAVREQGEDAREEWLLARRKDRPDLPINAALVSRKGSFSSYFPTEDRMTKAAMEGLGYLAPWVSVRSVGGTRVSDELLRRVIVTEAGTRRIEADKAPLEQGKEGSVLARQEQLTVLAAGRSLLERFSGSELVQENGSLLLLVESESEVYLDAGQTADTLQIFVNGQEVEIPEKMQAASPHRLISLGVFAGQEVEITVLSGGVLTDAAQLELGVLDIAMWQEALSFLDQPGVQGGTCALPKEQFQISEKDGMIRVQTEASAGAQLLVPFAALDGWSCVQNGKSVDIVPVFGGFMGITLAEGENEIIFSFVPPGLYTGLWMTALGMAAGLWMTLQNRRATGQNRISAGTDKVLGGLYRVLFAGGILGIYVVPALGLIICLAGKGLEKIG